VTGDQVDRPPLFVVRGEASAEEVAALTAVLTVLSAGSPRPGSRPVPEWSAHHRRVRSTAAPALRPGRGGWRSSGLPR
jgi:hypothetical protein